MSIIYAECHISTLYTECHNAEYRYAECLGAIFEKGVYLATAIIYCRNLFVTLATGFLVYPWLRDNIHKNFLR